MQHIKCDFCSHVTVMAIYLEKNNKKSTCSEKKHRRAWMHYTGVTDQHTNFYTCGCYKNHKGEQQGESELLAKICTYPLEEESHLTGQGKWFCHVITDLIVWLATGPGCPWEFFCVPLQGNSQSTGYLRDVKVILQPTGCILNSASLK